MNNLGANINTQNLKNTFPHPATKEDICVIFDVCHMLKLVRNTLASKGSIFDDHGGDDKMEFFCFLGKFSRTMWVACS